MVPPILTQELAHGLSSLLLSQQSFPPLVPQALAHLISLELQASELKLEPEEEQAWCWP